MKRYLAFVLVSALLMMSFVITPVAAAQPGEAIGNVLYSDVVAYIDGYPIRSYNINGYTYIIAEDLLSYGFYVEWRGSEGRLIIHTARTANYTANYVPEKNTHVVGSIAFPYLYTNVTTWIGSNQITGYNIGGNTCICLDDLYKYLGGSYVWNPDDVTLRLNTANRMIPSQTTNSTTPSTPPKTSETTMSAFEKLKFYIMSSGTLNSDRSRYSLWVDTDYSSSGSVFDFFIAFSIKDETIDFDMIYDGGSGVTMMGFTIDNTLKTPYEWSYYNATYDLIMTGDLYPRTYMGKDYNTLIYKNTNIPKQARESTLSAAASGIDWLLFNIDEHLSDIVTLGELGFTGFRP